MCILTTINCSTIGTTVLSRNNETGVLRLFSVRSNKQRNQLNRLIGPLFTRLGGSPSSGRQPSAAWRWRARRPHTHVALTNRLKMQLFFSLRSRFDSLRRSLGSVRELFWVLFSPCLRDPAPFVEEFAHNHHIVAENVLGHPYPVHSDVGCDVFPPFD